MLFMWDGSDAPPRLLHPPGEKPAGVRDVAFTHDGRIVSSDGSTLYVWDPASGALLSILTCTSDLDAPSASLGSGHGGGYGGYRGLHVTRTGVWAFGTNGAIYGW